MARNVVAEIRRATRRKFRADDKIRIVLEGLRGEISVSQLCRREGISPALYYQWSKAFLEAGKNGLTVDTKRDATRVRSSVSRKRTRRLRKRLLRPCLMFNGSKKVLACESAVPPDETRREAGDSPCCGVLARCQ